jgi:acyl carrier protein
VREAAVAVQGDSPESRRLVAYIVKSDAPGPTADEIRGFLKSRVPQYMIPTMFVEIDKLQVLPSGKIDYLALPKPTSEGVSKHQLLEGGQTDIERKLSAIWQEVLDVGQIQVDNNFFDLGGHSLHAMRVLSRVRRDFQIEIPIRVLFDRPTIAELAVEVRERQARVAVTASNARQPSVLLSMLRAELSALPPNQFDAFIQSVVAERNAKQSANS